MADRGRPRSFDRDAALVRAMHLFWEQGYEAASLSSLTSAMGINSPSLYAAFGSKEALYRASLELYAATEAEASRAVLDDAVTAREGVEHLLRRAVVHIVREDQPKGCFIMLGAIGGAPENRHLADYLSGLRKAAEQAIRDRIARGVADGDVGPHLDAAAMAGFYASILRGLSLSARDGASRAELDSTVSYAMAAWDAPLPREAGAQTSH